MNELLPCPFCGGEAKLMRFCGWWHYGCKECHEYPYEAMGCARVWGWITKRKAIEAWNRRVT